MNFLVGSQSVELFYLLCQKAEKRTMKSQYKVRTAHHEVDIALEEKLSGKFLLNGEPLLADIAKISDHEYHLLIANKSYHILVQQYLWEEKKFVLRINGKIVEATVRDPFDQLLQTLGIQQTSAMVSELKAPMPGLVLEVMVKPGQVVKKGDSLVILEAMKMENVLKAPADLEVKEVKVTPRQSVEKNQPLIIFK